MCVRTRRSGPLVEREGRRELSVRLDLRLQIGNLLLGSGDGIGAGDEAARRRLLARNRDERASFAGSPDCRPFCAFQYSTSTEPTEPPERLLCPTRGERQAVGDSQQREDLSPSRTPSLLATSAARRQSDVRSVRAHDGHVHILLAESTPYYNCASSTKVRFY
jgi:hypothetical protein